MNINNLYSLWCEKATEDEDLVKELSSIKGEEEAINDRFYKELEFGTGGLRGVIGAGTNRLNIYTIRKATQGLADYLKAHGGKKVAIGYDSRIKSNVFAKETAKVLAANGLKAYLYPRLEPTPALSWAVRYNHCDAGVCVTASHNPAKYNGYKVYGSDGCQITLEAAEEILSYISKVDCFAVKSEENNFIESTSEECLDAFIDAVYSKRCGQKEGLKELKIVYTPLNGSGLECVEKLFMKLGVKNYIVVPEQRDPDGNFPTCPYPNPEIREAMEKGLELVKRKGADLLIGTDPDCDRCGTAVPDGKGGYRLITGNEMGIILLDYIAKVKKLPAKPVAVTTIVSTDMATPLCEKYGIELRRVLTGFKFIGEQIGLLEKEGEEERYIFGFEESYGYLSSGHVRDKDAVNAVLLATEAAAYYREKGLTLLDAINALYEEHGYYKNDLMSFTFEGEKGMNFMKAKMTSLRENPPKTLAGRKITKVVDYTSPSTGLPKANVLEFQLEGKAKLMVRPSGTEPKIKIYLSATGKSEEESLNTLESLKADGKELMK